MAMNPYKKRIKTALRILHAVQSEVIFRRRIGHERGVRQDLQTVEIDGVQASCRNATSVLKQTRNCELDTSQSVVSGEKIDSIEGRSHGRAQLFSELRIAREVV